MKIKLPRFFACLTLLSMAAAAQAGPYLNNDVSCGECHPAQYAKHSQSIHLQMIRPATGAELTNVHGNLQAPKAPTPADFTHVIGGWYKEESYLKTEVVDGKTNYTVSRFEWSPIKGSYADDKPLRNWLFKCAGCHTTGFDPTTRTFQDFNIHCEKCHGPAADHASDPDSFRPIKDTSSEGCGSCHIRAESAATAEFPAKTFNFPIGYVLGEPSTLQFIPEAITNSASFYPDGRSNRHRQQYLDTHYPGKRITKHYEKGVTCTSCHDPHSSGTVSAYTGNPPAGKYGVKIYDNVNSRTNFVEWNGEGLKTSQAQLCTTCHTTIQNDHVHSFTSTAQTAAMSGQVSCVDCHMPDIINIDPVTLRGALHTHTYHIARAENAVLLGPAGQPDSCTYRCHQDKGATRAERAAWAAAYTAVQLTPSLGANMNIHVKGLKNFNYTIEGSTNLKDWSPLVSQKAVNGSFDIQDQFAGQYLFYRAIENHQTP